MTAAELVWVTVPFGVPTLVVGIFVLKQLDAMLGAIMAVHHDINSRVDQLLALADKERYAAGREAQRIDQEQRGRDDYGPSA